MSGEASLIPILLTAAFLTALAVSVLFGLTLGYYWLRHERRSVALASIAIYATGCLAILLFGLSTTTIGI